MAKRVLITGAAGFVGANLARRTLARGDEVFLAIGPDTDRYRLREIEGDAELIEADLREPDSAQRLVAASRPELVLHLATHGAYSWQTDAERIFETTVLGTVRLLRACGDAGVRRLINAGSSSEYGFKDHPPDEAELPEPNSDYAAAKVGATAYCGHFARSHDTDAITLRLYSVYGPWEHPDRLIPKLVGEALAGRLPPLVNPEVARDFVFIDDACSAFLAAAESVGGGSRCGLQRRERPRDDYRRNRGDGPLGVRSRGRAGLGIDAGAGLGHDVLGRQSRPDRARARLARRNGPH